MPNTKNTPGGHRPRVLIVDNKPGARSANQLLLRQWGFEPVLASGNGSALYQDALLQARRARCCLAMIDLRLIDDLDDGDTSGLNLAEEAWPVKAIIFSGHGNPKILREIMDEHRNVIFIGKTDPRKSIQEKLEREAGKLSAAKRGLEIDPPGILDEIAATPLGALAAAYPDQIADVFARLFPNARRLRLEKLDSSFSSAHISNVPRPKSIIIKVFEDEFQPLIVKLARPEKIGKEVERYNQFISRRLPHGYAPRLEGHTILWDIGGAAYSYVGDLAGVETFSKYYEGSSIENIEASLRAFFSDTWRGNYANARPCPNASLFQLYCSVWGREWLGRAEKFGMPSRDALAGFHGPHWKRESLAHFDTPDPLRWLIDKVANNPQDDASRVENTFTAVTHGDLHAENLLVDSRRNAWVVDFERSGEGHALQDFIELEADLLNRLSFDGEQVFSFYRLCVAITRQAEIGPIPIDEPGPAEPEIRKILQTMSIIRALARECTHISDMRQYLTGLLFNAIFRATIITSGDQHARSQQRSLMLASILCHRLEHWGESWPPEAWKNII